MPVARFQMPDGRVARFEVPDGTTPEQATTMMQAHFSGEAVPETPAPAKRGMLAQFGEETKQTLLGAARGAAGIGATLLAPVDAIAGYKTRRADIEGGLQSLGADPENIGYSGGKLTAELAGTGGIGQGIAKTAALAGAAKYAPNLLQSIASSGMTAGAAGIGARGIAQNALMRAAGGAITGAGAAGLINPEDAGTGALVGGVMPGAMQFTGWLGGKAGDLARGTWSAFSKNAAQSRAAQRLSESLDPGDLQKMSPALGQNAKPGTIPLSAAAITQNPKVARLEQASRIRTPETWYGFDQDQGRAVFNKVLGATDEATQIGSRSAQRNANWKAGWADVEQAVDPTVFNARIPKFQQDIETALMSSESVNPAVRGMLDTIKSEIIRTGDNFSPAHLQQIRANLSAKYNPMSPNAFASAPRDSKAVKDVLKEVDDILNASTGGVWAKVPAAYKADSNLLHQAKAASKVRGSFMDAETGRVRGVSLDPSGDIPKITEAGLGRSMDAARMPVTGKLALSKKAEGELSATLEALRSQNILQGMKRTSTAGGGSDTLSNAASLVPGGMTKNVLQQVVGAIKNAGSNKTEAQLAELLSDPNRAANVLRELANKKPNALAELWRNPNMQQLMYRAAPVAATR